MTEDELIAKHSDPNPHRPGADEVRMVENGVRLWAVIGTLLCAEGDIDQVMRAFGLIREAVQAAVA